MKTKAFTFIEVLVVVAIVALVAAMVFSVLHPPKKSISPMSPEQPVAVAIHEHKWGKWSDGQGTYNGQVWQSHQCSECGLQEGHIIDMTK